MTRKQLKQIIKEEILKLQEATDKQPEDYGITKYTWNSKNELDVNQDVDLNDIKLTELPFKFGTVKGNFKCWDNNITSLEGAPSIVSGHFYCTYNRKLTSLEGAPKTVGGDFSCDHNNLTSLKGAPEKTGGDFLCTYNKLTSLEGAPKYVGGDFWCSENSLTSLKGGPQKVSGVFSCSNNNLTSLIGASKQVGRNFYCFNNKVKFTEEDVKEVCNVKGKIKV